MAAEKTVAQLWQSASRTANVSSTWKLNSLSTNWPQLISEFLLIKKLCRSARVQAEQLEDIRRKTVNKVTELGSIR